MTSTNAVALNVWDSSPLNMPNPLELCVKGDFEKLFELYYDEPMFSMLNFHGYKPNDYLTVKRDDFLANARAKLKVSKNRHVYDLYSVTNFIGYQPIHYAAAHGDLQAVSKLVEKYKCSPVSQYQNSFHIACYFGHFEVVQYLVKDCGCYNSKEKEQLPFEFLCHEIEMWCMMWQNLSSREPLNFVEPKSWFEFDEKKLMGTDHFKIMMFLCEFCEFKLARTVELIFQYTLLCGDQTHLEFLEAKNILQAHKILAGKSSTLFIQLSLLGNNLEILQLLLHNNVIVSDAELLVSAIKCCVSDEVILLLVQNCSSSQVYAIVKHVFSEEISLIACVGYDAFQMYSRTAELSQFLLTKLIEQHGDSSDANEQNILHNITKGSKIALSLAYYILQRKPHLQRQPDSNGQLPLHLACFKFEERYPPDEVLNLVKAISSDCDVNAQDKDGNTALHIACTKDNWNIIEYLIWERKASITLRNANGIIPLHSIRWQFSSIVPIDSPLLISCDINTRDQDGNTLLHHACRAQNIEDIKYLVHNLKANIHVTNLEGKNALHLVSSWCQFYNEMVAIFNCLANDETESTLDKDSNTPLHTACSSCGDSTSLLEYLRERVPLSVRIYNNAGNLPIHCLLSKRFNSSYVFEVSQLLLQNTDADLPDANGNTPLHLACQFNLKNVIVHLIESRGAMTQVRNKKGELPLHLLIKKFCKNLGLIGLLIGSESLCIQDDEGNTPLHLACSLYSCCESSSIITFLLASVKVCPVANLWLHKSCSDFVASTLRPEAFDCLFSIKNHSNTTPMQLMLQWMLNHPCVVLSVLKNFSFENPPSSLCEFPLHGYFAKGLQSKDYSYYLDVIEVLLNSRNALITNMDGDGILHFVFSLPSNHFEEFIRFIPNVEELLQVRNEVGETPLHVACQYHNMKALKALKFILQYKNSEKLVRIKDHCGKTALHYMCERYNNKEAVKMLLECDSSEEFLDAQSKNGLTALHLALKNNFHSAAKLLLEYGCTPNMKDSNGNIPLHFARQCPMDVVKLLPITRQDVLTLNNDRLSPIHNAVDNYHVDLTRYLYEQCDYCDIVHMVVVEGAKLPIQVFFQKLLIQRTEFQWKFEEKEIVKMAGYFSEHRLDYDLLDPEDIAMLIQFMCKTSFIETDIYPREPLKHNVSTGKCSLKSPPYSYIDRVELMHAAAWFGRVDIIQYLIREENIDPCSTDTKGRNSLWFACGCSDFYPFYLWCTSGLYCQADPKMNAIQLLVETGCSIFNQDDTVSLFRWACKKQDLNLLKALTSAPESANLQDKEGNTPLMILITGCRHTTLTFVSEYAKFLIPKSNQSMTNNAGYSALHLACTHKFLLSIVKMLDHSHTLKGSHFCISPLEIAIKNGNIETLSFLISKLSLSSEQLGHLIYLCLQEKQRYIAKFLLKKIDIKHILEHGNTLAQKAMQFCILHGYKFCSTVEQIDSFGSTLLHLACQHNVPQIVKRAMNSSNVSIGNSAGDTPLHIACTYNRFIIVEMLKTGGANLKATNHKGNIPLHVASQFSAYKCIKALNIAEYDVKNEYSGDTALHIACSNESYACATALSSGSLCVQNYSGDTPLHIACQRGCFSIVYFLLKNFPDSYLALSTTNHQGELPLQLALLSFGKQMHTRVRLHAFFDLIKLTPNLSEHHQLMHMACQCKFPLKYKIAYSFKSRMVPINVPDAHGRLPIHYASSNTLDVLKVCSSQDIVNTQDEDGNTALHIACSKGRISICKYLVNVMKCDIFIPNNKGEVALHIACNAPSVKVSVCVLLFRAGSFVPDHSGNYPIHNLCKNFTNKAFQPLSKMMDILNEINLANTLASSPNDSGLLPIHYLCKSKESRAVEAVKIVIKNTDDLNAKTFSHDTPLHLACLSERHDIIELLANQRQQKCDVTIPTAFSNSPLHIVCKKGLDINNYAGAISTHGQNSFTRCSKSFNLIISYLSVQDCINSVNDDGDTPLHVLLKNDCGKETYYYEEFSILDMIYVSILLTLSTHGASCNIKNAIGEFPVHLACRYQNLLPVTTLDRKCGMAEKTMKGDNIFHYACQNLLLTAKFFGYLLKVGDVSLLREQNSDGNIPLHVYCMFQSNLGILKMILQKSDINHQNKDGNTPFHILIKNSHYGRYLEKSCFTEFIINECDLTLPNKKGHTALHTIANNGCMDFLIKEIFIFYSDAKKVDKLKHILQCAGEKFITKLFLSEMDTVKKLLDYNIDPTPLYKAYNAFFDDEQKPLQVPINLLFIGDAMTGKTTLVNSLHKEAGLEIHEKLVPERTAGISLSTFHSSKYGKVTAYDFAGQREYYAGHESVMQNIIQKTPPLVLIHVKLTSARDEIKKQIEYWCKFTQNRLRGMKCHFIIICSHADKISEEDIELSSRYTKEVVLKGVAAVLVCMDCRDSRGFRMKELVTILEWKSAALRHKGVTGFKAHCLYVLLTQHTKDKPFLSLNELFFLQRANKIMNNFLSLSFQEVDILCEELASDGQILLLKDRIPQNSVILHDTEVLLEKISGKLFAPKEFAIHERVSSNTGVVLFSKLRTLFPHYDANMMLKCLCSIEYCFEVQDAIVLKELLKETDCSPNERHYFFPGLISAERLENIIYWDPRQAGSSCWVLKCEDQEFFSPKFVQLLLLRLVFTCTKSKNILKSSAHIWTNGLFWCNGDGVETMITIMDTSRVIVFMQQRKPQYNVKLLKHRSTCINLVRELQHQICPSIHCKEYFTYPSHIKESFVIEDHVLVPMDEVLDALSAGDEFIDSFEIRKFVLFDPYAYLCDNLVKILLTNKDNKVSYRLMKYLTDHFYKEEHKIFIDLFGISITALEQSANLEPGNQFFQILRQWQKKTGGTVGELRQKFDSISIFDASILQSGNVFFHN